MRLGHSVAGMSLVAALLPGFARAQDVSALVALIPAPAATCDSLESVMAKFEAAYTAASQKQDDAMKALTDEVTSGKAGAMTLPPRQMIALQQWLMAPGAVDLNQKSEEIFGPLHTQAKAELKPLADKVSECEQIGEDRCDITPRLEKLRPGLRKLAAAIHDAWPQYLAAVKGALAYYDRPVPAGLDAKSIVVRQQLLGISAQKLRLVRQAADESTKQCVETQHLTAAMTDPGTTSDDP
jgi:hypothetical protein